MKQILVISGKGGTGKTTLTSAFSQLAGDVVLADCDVDAADLFLVVKPEKFRREPEDFYSGYKFTVDRSWCSGCQRCIEVCRFDALSMVNGSEDNHNWKVAKIDPLACEGCGCCADVCPAEAIKSEDAHSGQIFIADTRLGPMVYGRLGIAESNSGKMVAVIRKYAMQIAGEEKREYIVIDGSPGIGCPVIASLSGVNHAVIVTEPTLSGLHDLERILKLCRHFNISTSIIINKYDLNTEMSDKLEQYCQQEGIELAGKLPFDKIFVEATSQGKTILEYAPTSEISHKVEELWTRLS